MQSQLRNSLIILLRYYYQEQNLYIKTVVIEDNQYGKVTEEGVRFTADDLQANNYELNFNVDANGDGFLGKKKAKTEDKTTNTKLSEGTQGKAIATNASTNTSSVITYQGQTVATSIGNFQMIDAETINGVNYVLWNNNVDKMIAVWEMDSNWGYKSLQTGLYGSDFFYWHEAN